MDSSILKLVKYSLCFNSGLNFQNKAAIILDEYYKYKGYLYTNPNPAGGDDKNDGWVRDLGIYYQVFSPTNYPHSFSSDVLEKFKTDAEGLFYKVYDKSLWKKPINEFIFIVNTRDQSIPKDSSNVCETTINKLNAKYSSKTTYKLVNVDYLCDLLLEIDNERTIRNILIKLDVDSLIQYSEIDEKDIFNFLDELSNGISERSINNEPLSDYKRISSEKKITINKLESLKDRIETIIRKLDVVEKAVSLFNKTNPMSNVASHSIDFVISIYNDYKETMSGVELYNGIVDGIMGITPNLKAYKIPAEYFVVYVFDKCDIFEKE